MSELAPRQNIFVHELVGYHICDHPHLRRILLYSEITGHEKPNTVFCHMLLRLQLHETNLAGSLHQTAIDATPARVTGTSR